MSLATKVLRRVLPARTREKVHRVANRFRARLLPEPYRTVFPFTMASVARLRALDALARRVDELAVPGDVVECGTCNGGSAAILARVAHQSPHHRHVWLLDSFAGLPPATDRDGGRAAEYTGLCAGSPVRVREVLSRVGVPDAAVSLVPGWFQDTLPSLMVESIAILHIDADWYDSVLLVLDRLYDRVSPGGFVVLDDYGYWEGCQRAWDDFRAKRGITVDLVDVDGVGAYFQKPPVA
jgi:O-methyltransferase